MNRQRLDSPLVYVGAHNVYYVKLPVKVLYFTIHIHTQINQYVVISDFPPVSIDQLGISEMGRMARDLTHFIINSLLD
ncbi:two-component system connector SafA [Escherichia coli]|uniref:two-component system connector SafA n=1 Tax=Escherichia coli TaxID=562 RepID=UPI003344AAFB